MRTHHRGFALVGAGIMAPCFAFIPAMHQFCSVQGLSRAHAIKGAACRPSLNQEGHGYRGHTRTPYSYENLRRPRKHGSVGVSHAKGTGDSVDDGDVTAAADDTAIREARTDKERTAEIDKQVYQSEYLVGSKMMTISSFGPDSVASVPWRSGKGGKATTTRSAATTPEARMPEEIARQERLYEKRKWRLIGDNVFVGLLGTSGAWCLSFKAACSFGLGVTLGTAYLVLLSRFVENLGKEGSEGGGRGGGGGGGPARLALAGLLVLLVSKNKETLELIPALTGFLAYQVSTLVQGVYTDFDEVEDAEAAV